MIKGGLGRHALSMPSSKRQSQSQSIIAYPNLLIPNGKYYYGPLATMAPINSNAVRLFNEDTFSIIGGQWVNIDSTPALKIFQKVLELALGSMLLNIIQLVTFYYVFPILLVLALLLPNFRFLSTAMERYQSQFGTQLEDI